MITSQDFLNSGNYHRESKEYNKAIIDYKKAIDMEIKNPTHSSMINGIKFNLTGVLVEIREICDEHYNIADQYILKDDFYGAIDEFDLAIEEYSAIYCIKDEYYFEEIDRESSGFKSSIIEEMAIVYDILASCYEELEEYQEALSNMDEAIKLCPNEGYFYINRAQIYQKAEEYNKAIDDLTTAIALYNKKEDTFDLFGDKKEKLIQAYFNRAIYYKNIKNYSKAVKDCSKVIELEPDDIRSYDLRAYCYQQLEQYGKAIKNYSKVIDLCEEEDDVCFNAYRNRVDCYMNIKDYNSAKSDCEYLLDNEETFLPFAEDGIFDRIETFYNYLEQLMEDEENIIGTDKAIENFDVSLNESTTNINAIYIKPTQGRKLDL